MMRIFLMSLRLGISTLFYPRIARISRMNQNPSRFHCSDLPPKWIKSPTFFRVAILNNTIGNPIRGKIIIKPKAARGTSLVCPRWNGVGVVHPSPGAGVRTSFARHPGTGAPHRGWRWRRRRIELLVVAEGKPLWRTNQAFDFPVQVLKLERLVENIRPRPLQLFLVFLLERVRPGIEGAGKSGNEQHGHFPSCPELTVHGHSVLGWHVQIEQ